jgi:hypothetical protein
MKNLTAEEVVQLRCDMIDLIVSRTHLAEDLASYPCNGLGLIEQGLYTTLKEIGAFGGIEQQYRVVCECGNWESQGPDDPRHHIHIEFTHIDQDAFECNNCGRLNTGGLYNV